MVEDVTSSLHLRSQTVSYLLKIFLRHTKDGWITENEFKNIMDVKYCFTDYQSERLFHLFTFDGSDPHKFGYF